MNSNIRNHIKSLKIIVNLDNKKINLEYEYK